MLLLFWALMCSWQTAKTKSANKTFMRQPQFFYAHKFKMSWHFQSETQPYRKIFELRKNNSISTTCVLGLWLPSQSWTFVCDAKDLTRCHGSNPGMLGVLSSGRPQLTLMLLYWLDYTHHAHFMFQVGRSNNQTRNLNFQFFSGMSLSCFCFHLGQSGYSFLLSTSSSKNSSFFQYNT